MKIWYQQVLMVTEAGVKQHKTTNEELEALEDLQDP